MQRCVVIFFVVAMDATGLAQYCNSESDCHPVFKCVNHQCTNTTKSVPSGRYCNTTSDCNTHERCSSNICVPCRICKDGQRCYYSKEERCVKDEPLSTNQIISIVVCVVLGIVICCVVECVRHLRVIVKDKLRNRVTA